MSDTGEIVWVGDLRPGDKVDLEGDPIADPDHDNDSYPFELVTVVDKPKHETQSCIVIGFEGEGTIGFPVEHGLLVVEHDDNFDG